MLREISRSVARRAYAMAPARIKSAVQNIVLADLAQPTNSRLAGFPRAMLAACAARDGYWGLAASGEAGIFVGTLNDQSVLDTYARTGTWAEPTVRAIMAYFHGRSGTYLDIGANIGLTTIPVARNPRVHCIAFEPEPANFERLKVNIALNGASGNVVAHRVAVADLASSLLLERSPVNPGDNRLRTNTIDAGMLHEQMWDTVKVTTVRLDDVVDLRHTPLVVKIDVQGAEPLVVAGGERTLALADVIHFEFWPYGMHRMGTDPRVVIDFIREHFLVGAIAGGDREGSTSLMSINEIADLLSDVCAAPLSLTSYFDVVVCKAPCRL